MPEGLKTKAVRGLLWSSIDRGGQQAIRFGISIILARLLLPADFGLVAMLSIFMAVAQNLIDSGFGQALIQKHDATLVDESSIFYLNIILGAFIAGLLCLSAPWLAVLYKAPQLTSITRVLSLNLIINAFGLVQMTLMSKRVDFKTQMKVSITATIISGSVGVIMAYRGFGVWSLVASSLIGSFIQTVLLWIVYSWRPIAVFSMASLRSMYSYGSKLLYSGLLDTVYDNVVSLIIGVAYTATDLGFYSRAYQMQQLSAGEISNTTMRVMFPVFAALQNDLERLKRGVSHSIKYVVFLNFPLMIGFIVCARQIVVVLLTDIWLPTVPYFQLLCVIGMLMPLHRINLNVLKALGRSDLYFRLETIKKVLITLAILATYHWGIIAMIVGQIVISVGVYFMVIYHTAKHIKYSIFEQLSDILPTLALSVIAWSGALALKLLHIENNFILLALQLGVGVVLYVALCKLFNISAFVSLIEELRSRLRTVLPTSRPSGSGDGNSD